MVLSLVNDHRGFTIWLPAYGRFACKYSYSNIGAIYAKGYGVTRNIPRLERRSDCPLNKFLIEE